LTAEFKEALPKKDHLYLYDRLTSQSMLNLIELFEVLESTEEKLVESIEDA